MNKSRATRWIGLNGGRSRKAQRLTYFQRVQNLDGSSTYAAKGLAQESFNSSGPLTKTVDTDGLIAKRRYSSGHLTRFAPSDGHSDTFTCRGGLLQTITEPASRAPPLFRAHAFACDGTTPWLPTTGPVLLAAHRGYGLSTTVA